MSVESDIFKSSELHLDGQEDKWIASPHPLDDAFWGLTVVPRHGTINVEIEVLGQRFMSDDGGNRGHWIRIKNTGHQRAYFTLYAARSPNY